MILVVILVEIRRSLAFSSCLPYLLWRVELWSLYHLIEALRPLVLLPWAIFEYTAVHDLLAEVVLRFWVAHIVVDALVREEREETATFSSVVVQIRWLCREKLSALVWARWGLVRVNMQAFSEADIDIGVAEKMVAALPIGRHRGVALQYRVLWLCILSYRGLRWVVLLNQTRWRRVLPFPRLPVVSSCGLCSSLIEEALAESEGCHRPTGVHSVADCSGRCLHRIIQEWGTEMNVWHVWVASTVQLGGRKLHVAWVVWRVRGPRRVFVYYH